MLIQIHEEMDTKKSTQLVKKKLYQADHVISSLFARLPTNNLIHASVHLTLFLYLPRTLSTVRYLMRIVN